MGEIDFLDAVVATWPSLVVGGIGEAWPFVHKKSSIIQQKEVYKNK